MNEPEAFCRTPGGGKDHRLRAAAFFNFSKSFCNNIYLFSWICVKILAIAGFGAGEVTSSAYSFRRSSRYVSDS